MFKKPSIEEVKLSIENELKTIDFNSLTISPNETIAISPIYSEVKHSIHIKPYVSNRYNFQEFIIKSSNEKVNNISILEALENGISGIILTFKEVETISFEQLLENVRLDYIFTFINTIEHSIIKEFTNYTTNLKYELDPNLICTSFENNEINQAQFLFNEDFIISSANVLTQLNSSPLKNTFLIELGGDYYYDVCKIRAFKALLQGFSEKYSLKQAFHIFSFTSIKNKQPENLEFNILKATTEAMAGITAGCDGIWIQPFDAVAKEASHFSERISRNIFNLLKEEAYMELVDDPSQGSYFIENYTESIARNIFKHLKGI